MDTLRCYGNGYLHTRHGDGSWSAKKLLSYVKYSDAYIHDSGVAAWDLVKRNYYVYLTPELSEPLVDSIDAPLADIVYHDEEYVLYVGSKLVSKVKLGGEPNSYSQLPNADAYGHLTSGSGALFLSSGTGLYRSTDRGRSWVRIFYTDLMSTAGLECYGAGSGGDHVFALDDRRFGGPYGLKIYESRDTGELWHEVLRVDSRSYDPPFAWDGTHLLLASDGNVWRALPGGSAQSISARPEFATLTSLHVDAGKVFVGTSAFGVWMSDVTDTVVSVGSDDIEHQAAPQCYPQPANNYTTIKGLSLTSSDGVIACYASSGAVACVPYREEHEAMTIDVSGLDQGVWFVKSVGLHSKAVVAKVVVVR